MESILVIVHLVLSIGLVGLILIQHGKGADAGAAFGSGASSTVFGSQGSGNFLTRTTGILAAGFFATSLTLAGISMNKAEQTGLVVDSIQAEAMQMAAPKDAEIPDVPEDMVAPAAVNSVPVVEYFSNPQ